MIEFITGASGTGKTTGMFGRISSFCDEDRKVCIIVPEQYSSDFDKKLYFRLGAAKFNGLLSLSFSSLARHLFQLFGEPGRKGEYANDMARMILIYQAIAAAKSKPGQLTYFSRRCTHSGFAEEALDLINELKRSGITYEDILNRAAGLDSRLWDKASDIAAIYLEYQRLMDEYGFKDNLENIREAAKLADFHRWFRGMTVCIDEFESFTGDQLEMLRVIFSSAENVVITLRTDDVTAGEFTLFETVNNTYRQLTDICREIACPYKITHCGKAYRFAGADLEYVSRRIMRNLPPEPENAPKAENISIFEARDMYSEAEYVCARIKRLIHEDSSLKYRDIAIISNDIGGYSGVLKAAFARYDIPYFLSVERPVLHTSVMSFVISLLDLLTARRFRSEQIFRLLKCGLLEADTTTVSLLENYCYKWGIDGDTWCSEFTAEDRNLERIEELRKSAVVPVMKLKNSLKKEITAKAACGLLYKYLVDCKAERSLGKLMSRLIRSDKEYEAAELKRLWACLMDILDTIADTLGDKIISFSELAGIMRSMIGRLKYSVPPQTLDAVTAASARTARLDSPKIIFVMGANEGDFPNQVTLHGLFSESDKQKLADCDIKLSRPLADLIASERMIVYKALSTASHKLFISYPRSDLSGQMKYPARVAENLIEMFGKGILLKDSDIPPDFYAVTMHAAYYHYMQDKSRRDTSVASVEKLLLSDPEYSRRAAAALSRSGAVLESVIDSSLMQKLMDFNNLNLSATAMEKYCRCHFDYFCNYCLGLREQDKVELDALRSGDLIHSCLYNIIGSRTRKQFLAMKYEDICGEIDSTAEKYIEENLSGDFSKAPRFRLLFDKLRERIVGVFVHTQESLMASDFVPKDFEFKIEGSKMLRLPYGNGRTLTFGGIIDRTDVWEKDGTKYLRVVDYKSSTKVINGYTLANGFNLQMLLYLFAATEKNGDYSGYIPTGVLYTPVQLTDLDIADSKEDGFNSKEYDKNMRTTGLLTDDMEVLNAMEHDIKGRFIPANVTSKGILGAYSSVMPSGNMDKLKELVYKHLTDTAESLLSGKIDALPLMTEVRHCGYCSYSDICGNSTGRKNRPVDVGMVALANDIIGKKKKTDSSDKGGND